MSQDWTCKSVLERPTVAAKLINECLATAVEMRTKAGQQQSEIERLQAYPAAVNKIRSYYPIDVFPHDSEGPDCIGAKFARSLCDQIHKEAAEAVKEA